MREAPFVSVIVPVLNDARRIARCVEGLLDQDYPKDRVEVIVVDNGSGDDTPRVVRGYPVTLLVENRRRTPYLARNTGIEHSRGDVIALVDGDCVPRTGWLSAGIRTLRQEGADLVGGKVSFLFSRRRDAGECFDSISNLENENNIRERGVAKTANLFFHRRVIEAIGPFPDRQRSGGDVWWTGKATRAGFRLVYAPEAEVRKPARRLTALLAKQYRVGRGQLGVWRESGAGPSAIAFRLTRGFLPPSPVSIRRSIRERGTPDMEESLASIWSVGWACRLVTNFGRFRGLLGG